MDKKNIKFDAIRATITNVLRGAFVILGVIGEYEEKFMDEFGEKIKDGKRVQIKANGDVLIGILTRVGHKYVELKQDNGKAVRIRADKIIWVKDAHEEKADATDMP